MIERFRSSGGVLRAAAKPFDPTGSTRVPSQAGAAVAFPIRVTAGLGAGVAGVAGGAVGVVAGTGVDGVPEQPAATPHASRTVRSRRSRTGPVCPAASTGPMVYS